MNFSFAEIDTELYLIRKDLSFRKKGHGSDISGPYWMLIEIDIQSGGIFWQSDSLKKYPKFKHAFIYLPPFSWTIEHYDSNTQIRMNGLISSLALAARINYPILFYSDAALPETLKGVVKFLENIGEHENISVCSNPCPLSLKTKRLLDKEYQSSIEIKDIAAKLKTHPSVVSRAFKTDFGQAPAFYRKGLRITVGMYELMMGKSPIEAAQLAGYSDLGRFYKQFKDYLKQTPSQYFLKSKNAKTSPRN